MTILKYYFIMKTSIISATIIVFFIYVSAYGKTYIGTIHNTTHNVEAPCVLKLDDKQDQGQLFIGNPLLGSPENFTIRKTGNEMTFNVGNIEYKLTVSNDGIIGKYKTSNNQEGTCSFNIEITDKNSKIYTESIAAIELEAFFDYFHPTGEARSVEVEKVNAIFDNNKLLKLNFTCILSWQGPIQAGTTKFSIEYDQILNRFSYPKLIETSGFTNEDTANAIIGGAALLINAAIQNSD